MEIKKQAALTATIVNGLLTGLKFALYCLSGSLVVLVEAWHSFSDIATSALLFLAFLRGAPRTGPDAAPAIAMRGIPPLPRSLPSDGDTHPSRRGGAEVLVSLAIGVLLLCVSTGLIYRALSGPPIAIRRPIQTGLIFLLFAIGSSFLSRFETRVGMKHGSIGLIADGHHSKADMVASLLAGVSLILYGFGIDIDRWAALAISALVLSLSVEVLVNAALILLRKESPPVFAFRSSTFIARLCDPETVAAAFSSLDKALGGRVSRSVMCRRALRQAPRALLVLALAAWLSTCLYTVAPPERAIRTRCGKAAGEAGPGLHLKRPWPFDRVIRQDVAGVRRLPIGNLSDAHSSALLWTKTHGTEEPFLSGDNTYVFPYLLVHYRIGDASRFSFAARDPESLLDDLAHRRLTLYIATRPFYQLAASDRARICTALASGLQEDLDTLGTGIEVLEVNIRDIHPPVPISGAFEETIAALQTKQQLINEAHAYRNQALPESRGQSSRTVESARADAAGKIERARGDAARFVMRATAHARDPEVSSARIYMDAMQAALLRPRKIVFDPGAGCPSVFMGPGAGPGDWFREADSQ